MGRRRIKNKGGGGGGGEEEEEEREIVGGETKDKNVTAEKKNIIAGRGFIGKRAVKPLIVKKKK